MKKQIPQVHSNGGRSIYETNDCTVMALAHAADLPYMRAHDICKMAGRKDKNLGRFAWD